MEQKVCGLTAVSKKNLSFVYFAVLSDKRCSHLDIPTVPTPDPTPSLGRENSLRLGHFLLFGGFWTRTYVLSQGSRSFPGMTSPTPTTTTTHRSAPQGNDPSDLLNLTLRFGSSAYLASERYLATSQIPEPEPAPPFQAVAKPLRRTTPSTPPRLIVGQALDRLAA